MIGAGVALYVVASTLVAALYIGYSSIACRIPLLKTLAPYEPILGCVSRVLDDDTSKHLLPFGSRDADGRSITFVRLPS